MMSHKMLPRTLIGFCVIGMSLLVLSGCNQRVDTPEVEYSQTNVDLIKQQIEATEW